MLAVRGQGGNPSARQHYIEYNQEGPGRKGCNELGFLVHPGYFEQKIEFQGENIKIT